MVKTMLFGFVFVFGSLMVFSQSFEYEYVYRNQADSSINCYLKVIPKKTPVQGLIVRDFSSLPDTSRANPYAFQRLSAEKGFMTIYAVTSRRFPELYYFDDEPALLDEIIHEVMTDHDIASKPVFAGGISASGTRALRFAIYCVQGKSKFNTVVNGVFVVDSPLDLERFYHSAKNHRSNFKDGMLSEAHLILEKFPEYIGTPEANAEQYYKSSVHNYRNPDRSNLKFLKDIPVLFFHEPDLDWWLEQRGSAYYDMNSFDIGNTAATLKQLGNKDVEVITTTGKGYNRKGVRNCHSWTIVDEQYLVEWISKRTDSKQ